MNRIAYTLAALVLILLLTAGSVSVGPDDERAKIIVIIFGIHEKGAFLESAEVRYGHAPIIGYQEGNFTGIVRARNGTPLFVFDIWDPLYQIDDYGYHYEPARHELERHEMTESQDFEAAERGMAGGDDIDLPLIIPYHPDIYTVDLADKDSGTTLASACIAPAWQEFVKQFPHDPDVEFKARQVPGKQNLLLLAGTLSAIILLGILARLIRKA